MKIEISSLIYNISMILLVIIVSFIVTKFVGRFFEKEEIPEEEMKKAKEKKK